MRKGPVGRGFMGVQWTNWPWPSKVIGAIYRMKVGKPKNMDYQFRKSMFHKLAIAYAVLAWTSLGYFAFSGGFSSDNVKDMTEEEKEKERAKYIATRMPNLTGNPNATIKTYRIEGLSVKEGKTYVRKELEGTAIDKMSDDDVRKELRLDENADIAVARDYLEQRRKHAGSAPS